MKKLLIIAIAIIGIVFANSSNAKADIAQGSGKLKFELKDNNPWLLCLGGEGSCNLTIEIEIPIPIGNPPQLTLGPGQIAFVVRSLNNEFAEAVQGQIIQFDEVYVSPDSPDIIEGTTDATLHIPAQNVIFDAALGGFIGYLYLE